MTLFFVFLEKKGLRTYLWALVFAEFVPVLTGDVAAIWQKSVPHSWVGFLFWGGLLAALALRWKRSPLYYRCVHGLRLFLLLVGCGLAWMVPELLYFAVRAQPVDVRTPATQNAKLPAAPGNPDGHRRIIWLLFDELSFKQAFAHPMPGVALPAFDKLKSQSISFSNVQPAGYTTERVVPSLFLGHVVTNLVSNLDGEPRVTLSGQKGWHAFDAKDTLFGDAKRLGWTTGVVGWYNPYCRILAGTLDYCFWRMGDGLYTGTSPDQTALQNAAAPLKQVLHTWFPEDGLQQQKKHTSDLDVLLTQAEALIRDPAIGFVFIHLPVPHPPGIYDRKRGQWSGAGTYLDNLVLADRVLSQLMATIEATPAAATTSVIVCSDHSWRVPLWRPTPQWSKEEESATHGHFDQRPVLMVHSPEQQTEQDQTGPFEAVGIHDILERLLRGQSALP